MGHSVYCTWRKDMIQILIVQTLKSSSSAKSAPRFPYITNHLHQVAAAATLLHHHHFYSVVMLDNNPADKLLLVPVLPLLQLSLAIGARAALPHLLHRRRVLVCAPALDAHAL